MVLLPFPSRPRRAKVARDAKKGTRHRRLFIRCAASLIKHPPSILGAPVLAQARDKTPWSTAARAPAA
ncbi:MAG TPA: hypothetical protein VJ890_25920 [Vineibacter sp.]|nr:hypothetical protein [Vineibacter sp.]